MGCPRWSENMTTNQQPPVGDASMLASLAVGQFRIGPVHTATAWQQYSTSTARPLESSAEAHAAAVCINANDQRPLIGFTPQSPFKATLCHITVQHHHCSQKLDHWFRLIAALQAKSQGRTPERCTPVCLRMPPD